MRRQIHEANRLSWNAATAAHNTHKGDQAAWLRAGGSTLFPEERGLLGELAGRTLLHEWPYSNGFAPYEGMWPLPGRRWAPPEGVPEMPLMYGVAARKPA